MPRMPKNSPRAVSEKATGKPSRKKRIRAPNISGGITPYWNNRPFLLLKRLRVVRIERDFAAQCGDPLDDLGEPLEREEGEADLRRQQDRPLDQAAIAGRHLPGRECPKEDREGQPAEEEHRREQEDDHAEEIDD